MSCTRKRSLSQIYSLAHPDVVAEEMGPKSGKWSAEEEMFANKLIAQFEAGTLTDCAEGSTLRSYLARKLNCAPMRISKKFAGQCIGKHTFTKKEPCVVPATDRDSLSEASTLTRPSAVNEDPLDFMWDNAVDIMSFDSFADFQDVYIPSSSGAVAYPVPEQGRAGMNAWCNPVEVIPQNYVYPPQKRQVVTVVESPCVSEDVGLDLDNMYSSCSAPKMVPFEVAPVVPAPTSAFELPMKKDWGLRCTIPAYDYRPKSPSTVVPSGAAVVTPTNAGGEGGVAADTCSSPVHCKPAPAAAFVPGSQQCLKYEECQKYEQYQQCQKYEQCQRIDACTQTNLCNPADLEAAEWRDVLDYFCGPQALYC